MQTLPPSFEQTQQLAYHLWRQANCPPGQDLDFWLQAERQLTAAPAVNNGAEKRKPVPARKPARKR